MRKTTKNIVQKLQAISREDLTDWLGHHDLTEETFGMLIGRTQRSVSLMTNGHRVITETTALVVNLINGLSAVARDCLLQDLKQLSAQLRHSHRRPK